MPIVPFKRNTKPESYAAPSGPGSKGRMPTTMSTPALEVDTGPDPTKTMPAPESDGGIRGHDTNYTSKPRLKS